MLVTSVTARNELEQIEQLQTNMIVVEKNKREHNQIKNDVSTVLILSSMHILTKKLTSCP